ncbi:MAG: hypothetical protein ABH954_00265 [Candidatus Omnitrophota bacterium]
MNNSVKYLLTFVVISSLSLPVYAQPHSDLCKENNTPAYLLDKSVKNYFRHERYNSDTPQKSGFSIIQLFKSKAFAAAQNIDADRKRIREEWKEFLGLDVFYPYFKAKEVEDYVQKKSSVKLFNMRGKAELNNDTKEVKYIFKKKF